MQSGAVWVYERKSAGWRVRRVIKPAVQADEGYGTVVALRNRGRTDPLDQSEPERGAAWLY